MEFSTRSSPHRISEHSVTRVMALVLVALVPGTFAMWWYFGWGVIVNIMLTTSTAVAAEAAILKMRGRPVGPVLIDLSAVVTAWLLALGGIAYTVGAVVYAIKRPNPRPSHFGYHEVFHALTLVGAGLHLAAVFSMLRAFGQ